MAGETGLFVLVAICDCHLVDIVCYYEESPYVSSIVLGLYPVAPAEAGRVSERLATVAGVKDVSLVVEEQTAYLKVDKNQLDEQHLRQYGDW